MLDIDSHADTCELGANYLAIQYHGRPVNVLSYNPALGERTYQTVRSVSDMTIQLRGKHTTWLFTKQ